MNFREQMEDMMRQLGESQPSAPERMSRADLLDEVVALIEEKNPGMVTWALDVVAMRHRLPLNWRATHTESEAEAGQPAS